MRFSSLILYKKISPLPAVFSNAQKGRKGEKEMGILNWLKCLGSQGPEERECRRESESPGPQSDDIVIEIKRINPFDES